jgi:glyoxylase-like metal-dependent hydrolase (beta-lactamase superfamily II)
MPNFLGLVNTYLLGPPGASDNSWVLVGRWIITRVLGGRPAAIVLTHGHFDHVGALQQLISYWDAPVYAHELELPYRTIELPAAGPRRWRWDDVVHVVALPARTH